MTLPEPVPYATLHAWHLYTPLMNPDARRWTATRFMQDMKDRNIGVGLHYPAVHEFSVLPRAFRLRAGRFPEADFSRPHREPAALPDAHADEDQDDAVAAMATIAAVRQVTPRRRAMRLASSSRCYNEQDKLATLFPRLTAAMAASGKPYEILFVDDGSRDRSVEMLRAQSAKRLRSGCVVVEFSAQLRPAHGHHGRHSRVARGEVIVTLDADLQNPPEEIPKLLAAMDEGHDVVGGCGRSARTRSSGEPPPGS